jgi:putative transcriptional regulator
MAIVRKSLEEIRADRPKVDHAKLIATTDEDLRHQQIADDESPDASIEEFEPNVLPRVVRRRLGMTQDQFATALRIPVNTLRNWEQGRVKPDPAARSLMLIVYRNPEAALAALAV